MKKILFLIAFLASFAALAQTIPASRVTTSTDKNFATDIEKGNLDQTSALGTIISDDFNRGSLGSNYTKVGSTGTFTITSNQLVIAAGINTLTEYERYNAYGNTNLENWTADFDLVPGTINSTSYGVWFGLQSQAAAGLAYSVQVGFLLDATNKGKIVYYYNNATTNSQTSTTALTVAAADVTHVTVTLLKNVIITTWTSPNKTAITHTLTIPVAYPIANFIIPNGGHFAFGAIGGSHTVDNLVIASRAKKKADWLLIGDSIWKGYNLANINDRAADVIASQCEGSFQVYAQGGNRVDEVNTAEVIALAPRNILVNIGTNNLGNGDSQASYATKFATMMSAFTGAGYVLGTNLFVGTLIPRNSNDVTAYNTGLTSTYASGLVDFNLVLRAASGTGINASLSPDGTHPNQAGNQLLAQTFINRFASSLKMKAINNGLVNLVTAYSNKVGLGLNNQSPNYILDVYNTASQIRFGASLTDAGGYLTSVADNSSFLSAGASFDATNWKARATTAGFIGINGNAVQFFGNSGLTVGSNMSPTSVASISPTGLRVGDTGAALHPIDAFSATKSQAHFSINGADIGGYLVSTGASVLTVSGGAAYDISGVLWRAKATTASFYTLQGGEIDFFGNTGLTVGNTFTPTGLGSITPTGWYVGTPSGIPTSTLQIGGSFATFSRSITALRTLDITDQTVFANGTFTVTLPTAVGIADREYLIKNTGSGTITIATTSSQTIDGSTTQSLATQYKYIRVKSDGAAWYIIANN